MEALGVLDHLPATARLSINVPVRAGDGWDGLGGVSIGAGTLDPQGSTRRFRMGRYDIELPNTPLTCIGIKESDRPARAPRAHRRHHPDAKCRRAENRPEGESAAMLSAATNAKRSPETGDLSLQVEMVAGARNQRYLQLWRVAA